jgi:hypothetical protein
MRVRDHDEHATMLQRLDGDRVQGLVVLVVDHDEVTLVNLVGEIDPERLAELFDGLDGLHDLDLDLG